MPYVIRNCNWCKKRIKTHTCQISRGGGRYCSRQCARRGSPTRKRTRKKLLCFLCGNLFTKHLSEIRKSKEGRHFCSSKCWYEWHQLGNHAGYAGGQDARNNPEMSKWRKLVLAKDKSRCRVCMSSENLQAHHIKRFATHPELRTEVSNGLTLCKDCHLGIAGREEEYADLFLGIASFTNEYFVETYGDLLYALSQCGPEKCSS